jgi:alpha-1,6-mannosyltransferase
LLACLAYGAGFVLLVWSFLLSDNQELKHQMLGDVARLVQTSPKHAALAFTFAVASMGAGYVWLLRSASQGELATGQHRRQVWTLVGGLVALFVCMPPFLDVDLVSYYHHGWLVAVKGTSPNLVSLGTFDDVPAKALMKGAKFPPSPYGPLWTQLEALTYRATGDHVWLGLLFFKLYAALATIVLAMSAADYVSRLTPQHELGAILFVGANPLVLVEGPGMAHNDVAVLAVVAVGIWLQMRVPAKQWLGPFVGMLGTLIKITAIPAAIVMLWWAWKQRQSFRNRSAITLKVMAPWFVLLIVLGAPFIREVADVPFLFGLPNSSLHYEIGFTPVHVIRDVLVNTFRRVGLHADPAFVKNVVLAFSLGVAATVMFALVRKAATHRSTVASFGPVYLVATVAVSYWRPWYAIWPAAMASMGSAARWKFVIIAYSLLALETSVFTRSTGILFCCM